MPSDFHEPNAFSSTGTMVAGVTSPTTSSVALSGR